MKRSKMNAFTMWGGTSQKGGMHWYRLVSCDSERGSEALGGDSYGC